MVLSTIMGIWRCEMASESKVRSSILDAAAVIASIDELRQFPANWDGYGAVPLDPKILDAAASLIESFAPDATPTPQVVPMTRGRVQLEWHRGSRSLELEFESREIVHFLKWESKDGTEAEDRVPVQDTAILRELLNWFASG